MANVTEVYGSLTITKLVNGDTLNARLYSTNSLYQTFKKGTSDFNPNWETMPDADRPIIFPRVYSSVLGSEVDVITDVSWLYNQQPMSFNGSGIATAPDVCAGKVQKVTYQGREALKMIGNVASDNNNTSDTITFNGRVNVSGQEPMVSAETTILIEESASNIYRLLLESTDNIIDGDETGTELNATLYSGGHKVTTGVEFLFVDMLDNVLQSKSSNSKLDLDRDDVHGEIIVVCKAYVGNKVVAEAQRQILDWTDPFIIQSNVGDKYTQDPKKDETFTFSVINQRTGNIVPGATFVIRAWKLNPTRTEITSEMTITPTTIFVPGAKIDTEDTIQVIAGPVTIN